MMHSSATALVNRRRRAAAGLRPATVCLVFLVAVPAAPARSVTEAEDMLGKSASGCTDALDVGRHVTGYRETGRLAEGRTRLDGPNRSLPPNPETVGRVEEKHRTHAGLAPEMIRIPGGCIRMGGPKMTFVWEYEMQPQHHEVCVEDFSIGRYEVTRAEYSSFTRTTGNAREYINCWVNENGAPREQRGDRHWRSPGYEQADDHPVVCVDHADAEAYARWLSGEMSKRYRLPTEAEWEYAARGGTTTLRHWGDDPAEACEYANVADRTLKSRYPIWVHPIEIHECWDGHVHSAPVGSYRANGYGLYDILGNVKEWTSSTYSAGYGRVKRGGSWNDTPTFVQSAFRNWDDPSYRSNLLGFRLAQSIRGSGLGVSTDGSGSGASPRVD